MNKQIIGGILNIPAYIHKIETMADKGLKMTIITQELAPEDQTKLFSYKDRMGWITYSEAKLSEEDLVDLPPIKNEFKGNKTPAERLRAVLYVWWNQQGGADKIGKPFDDFYKDYIEKIIDHIKEKINP